MVAVRECLPPSPPGEVSLIREPAVIRGVDIGAAVALWRDSRYLAKKCAGRKVRVHSCSSPHMDFLSKNFSYE